MEEKCAATNGFWWLAALNYWRWRLSWRQPVTYSMNSVNFIAHIEQQHRNEKCCTAEDIFILKWEPLLGILPLNFITNSHFFEEILSMPENMLFSGIYTTNDYTDKSVPRVILVKKNTSLMTQPHCLHPTLISVRRNRPWLQNAVWTEVCRLHSHWRENKRQVC